MAQHTHNRNLVKLQNNILIHNFIKIIEDWDLTEDEAFDISNLQSFDIFQLWNYGIFPKVDEAVYSQLSAINDLNLILLFYLPKQSDRRHWLRSKEDTFFGRAPIENILGGHTSSIRDVIYRVTQKLSISLTS